jgi:hypothetical protein
MIKRAQNVLERAMDQSPPAFTLGQIDAEAAGVEIQNRFPPFEITASIELFDR